MLKDQFILPPSWLPSPRIEIQTLAGYSTHAYTYIPLIQKSHKDNRMWDKSLVHKYTQFLQCKIL